MNYNIEYIDIILLAMIAGFIILRLRNILGRKTGHREKPFSRYSEKASKNQNNEKKASFLNFKKETEFDEEQKKYFLEGAKIAYETIITAFAKGDKKTLKPLLSTKIFEEFSSAIDDRNNKKIISNLTFVGLKSAEIKKLDKIDNIYNVKVNFISEIISCLKDKENKIIEGDQDTIKTVNDHWKFSRNMWSENPTWYLVDTQN